VRVVFLIGRSNYGAFQAFADELAAAFRERGYEPDVFTGPDSTLEEFAARGPSALAFSFNSYGDFRTAGGRSVSEVFQCPHVVHFLDHPLTHLVRLEATAPDVALLAIDPTHVDAVNAAYPAGRFSHVAFAPHGGVGAPRLELDAEAFAAARPTPILFAGSFYRPEGPPPWAKLPTNVQSIFEEAVERALACEWTPALSALDAALRRRGLNPEDSNISALRLLASYVHEHVRSHRRFELLKTAARLGLPLHVYGVGYEKVLYRFKNVTYGGEASFAETIELMGRSRVVLNINANFGAGSHERPLSALLAGAAAATDHSTFYEQNFAYGSELAVYRWRSLDADLAAIGELAENPSAAWDMARAGQARVLAGHRWAQRVEGILAAAEAADRRRLAA
jgi:hypothetical protein